MRSVIVEDALEGHNLSKEECFVA